MGALAVQWHCEHEKKVYRHIVRGVEVQGFGRLQTAGHGTLALGQAAVGYGDALAETGGAQPLPLQQPLEQTAGIHRREPRREQPAGGSQYGLFGVGRDRGAGTLGR